MSVTNPVQTTANANAAAHATARASAPTGAMRVVLVGERFEIAHAMQHPSLSNDSAFAVVGAVPYMHGKGGFPEEPIRRVVQEERADTLMVVGGLSRSALTLFGELAVVLGCRLLSLIPHGTTPHLSPVLVWEGNHPFLELGAVSDRHRFDKLKRVFDVMASGVALLVLAPLLAAAALMVRAESEGSPLFGHLRIGRGGTRFRCWKLRTMHPDAEQRLASDPELFARYRANDFKLPDAEDPRITCVGRMLRKTSIDELPQLWNVFRGEMSLVGPRPIVAEELPYFRGDVLTLLSVRPGITGAWAVNGRHHLAYPRRAEVELAYVRTRSIATDASILLRTIGAVLDPGFGLRS
jgi:lipopolysaccharide/colanic/teichoic acid biosynthesis glycosyltransferase